MTNEEKDFKEVGLGEVITLEKDQELVGSFISLEKSAQYDDSYAFRIKVGDEIKVVFVNKIVKDLVEAAALDPGMRVKLVYKGLKKNLLGTREYKDYKLFLAEE